MINSLPGTTQLLIQEVMSLSSRLERVEPFALNMPMVAAAEISTEAQRLINRLIHQDREKLNKQLKLFVNWLRSNNGKAAPPDKQQHMFALLKLRFNALLDQLDIFADVLNQRSEHDVGIWLAGLDVFAKDALNLKAIQDVLPPLICYLDRGHGAAIRRARTRLPGGSQNPVAIIRVPRERMVGSGIGSSLVHEVGHQGSVLLGMLRSMRLSLQQQQREEPEHQEIWSFYERWISEIISDTWSVAHLGIGATQGLIGVVSLPSYFVFRINRDAPHPFPYIRVKISAALGEVLYPNEQWKHLISMWEKLYPLDKQPEYQQNLIHQLEDKLPSFVQLLLNHHPPGLKGKPFREIFPIESRQPEKLRSRFRLWKKQPSLMKVASPTFVFAVLGQARFDNKITPAKESKLFMQLLRHWALRSTLMFN